MRVIVVEPPAPVVSWEDADRHLKLDGDTDQKSEVEEMVAAAIGHIDGPEGWLGRALGVQTLELRCDGFCEAEGVLPYPPAASIVSVKYLDRDTIEQTLAADQYELLGDVFGLAYRASWPASLAHREAIRVRYTAGFAELPKPIRSAILLMTEDLYRHRGSVAPGTGIVQAVPMSTTVINLLTPFRVYS